MASIRKRHEDFIRELQAPLKPEKKEKEEIPSDEQGEDISDLEIQRVLEKKFDELFGPISETEDDST